MADKSKSTGLSTSTRSIMAGAMVILVVALSFRFGWFGSLWHATLHQFDHGTEQHEHVVGGLQDVPNAPELSPLAEPMVEPVMPEAPPMPEEDLFVIVETPPVLVGGLASLQENITYPAIAKKAGIQGRVFLQFIVEKSGHVSNIVVTRGIGGGCDEEAVRALSEAHFEPGLQRGKRVRVKMSLPVSFRLE